MNAATRTPASSPGLDAAYERCREVCRARARNFYYGLRLSPEPQRSALFSIYAWMRAADDLVDDASAADGSGVQQRLSAFRAATDAALCAEPPRDDPIMVALAETARRYVLPREYFHAMLDGQIDDVRCREYRTFEDLRPYCYRVASTVGLVCIGIWGYTDPRARDLAVDRGIAFQLTNVLRDFKQDFDSGRIYLPREDFARHGLAPADVRHWKHPPRAVEFLSEQMARAAMYYERSEGLEAMISRSCQPTVWAMTAIYKGLLAKMSRDPSQIITSKRVRLSAWRKGVIAMRAKWLVNRSLGTAAVSRGMTESASA